MMELLLRVGSFKSAHFAHFCALFTNFFYEENIVKIFIFGPKSAQSAQMLR